MIREIINWPKGQDLCTTTVITATTTTTPLHLQYSGEIWTKSKDTMCIHKVKKIITNNYYKRQNHSYQRINFWGQPQKFFMGLFSVLYNKYLF